LEFLGNNSNFFPERDFRDFRSFRSFSCGGSSRIPVAATGKLQHKKIPRLLLGFSDNLLLLL
jgi:hypothetical protein